MLELARNWFGITRPIVRASTLGLSGQKSDRIIDMCKKVGAKIFGVVLNNVDFRKNGDDDYYYYYYYESYGQDQKEASGD